MQSSSRVAGGSERRQQLGSTTQSAATACMERSAAQLLCLQRTIMTDDVAARPQERGAASLLLHEHGHAQWRRGSTSSMHAIAVL